MGLFDSVFGGLQQNVTLSPPEGFAGILLRAVACDGHIADEEVNGLWTILPRMKMFQSWGGPQYNAMTDKLIGILKREGLESLLNKSAAVLPQELRETAFANACDLVLADGVVDNSEKEFLNNLCQRLQVSGDKALTIVEVLIIKNRG
jgi:hypothetical protein